LNLRNKVPLLVFFYALNMAACGALAVEIPAATTDEPQVRKHLRQIIIIGDSIMQGSFHYPDQAEHAGLTMDYSDTTAARLNREHNRCVHNISKWGQTLLGARQATMANTVKYLTHNGTEPGGTAVWIQLGYNDWSIGRTIEQMFEDYVHLLWNVPRGDRIRYYCAVPIINKADTEHTFNAAQVSLEQWRDKIRWLGNSGMCDMVETDTWFDTTSLYSPDLLPDGVHMGATAHEVYTSKLLEAIDYQTQPLR
jgi:hypothetical protein